MEKLRCPECGEGVLHRYVDEQHEVVVFKCLFSATFDKGINAEEAQKKLDEFKSSGRMKEWAQTLP